MHLSPNNEELFSLIARLFPGKQIAEIKSSALYIATVKQLQTAFQISAPKKPPHFLRWVLSSLDFCRSIKNVSISKNKRSDFSFYQIINRLVLFNTEKIKRMSENLIYIKKLSSEKRDQFQKVNSNELILIGSADLSTR